ncbi:hypothetical protein BX666DRAFT_659210 [Dichotomocladium elegans]|nr:hypothetical protein BX666DRAFT_659210 [Dichotomocladium elegans]
MQHCGRKDPVVLNVFFLKSPAIGPCVLRVADIKKGGRGYWVVRVTLLQKLKGDVEEEKVHAIVTMGAREDHVSFAVPRNTYVPPPPSLAMMRPAPEVSFKDKSILRAECAFDRDQVHVLHALRWGDGRPIDVKSLPCFADVLAVPPWMPRDAIFAKRLTLQLEVQFFDVPREGLDHVLTRILVADSKEGHGGGDGWLYDDKGNLLASAR